MNVFLWRKNKKNYGAVFGVALHLNNEMRIVKECYSFYPLHTNQTRSLSVHLLKTLLRYSLTAISSCHCILNSVNSSQFSFFVPISLSLSLSLSLSPACSLPYYLSILSLSSVPFSLLIPRILKFCWPRNFTSCRLLCNATLSVLIRLFLNYRT